MHSRLPQFIPLLCNAEKSRHAIALALMLMELLMLVQRLTGVFKTLLFTENGKNINVLTGDRFGVE
ncbi:hypothetical protein C6N34_002190 [Cylindrospermopsis raciborskii Cr2010]|uniref:hypothetical protein n=1 Tax=Cylindrospermopsis raciborskii TaxID=77022 RepID=UPI001F2DD1A5|nr:hypothetical protein [Cylindrospermopsis raciborskii]UJL34073.1 hypothetical protein C6N34_002190 [Cylindrospermopsis raciborskii Cr2010]